MPDLALPDVDSFMSARQSDGDPSPAPDDLPNVDAFMQTRPRRASPSTAPASPETYRITDRYGAPRPGRIHSGTDFAEPMGTPLGAAASGRVVFAGKRGGYGNAIDIKDPDGNVHRYGHLQQIGVGVGDIIGASEQIGLVGSTGHSTGAHTHYEVRPNGGGAIDPLKTSFRPVFGSYVKPFAKLPDVNSFMSNRQPSTGATSPVNADQPAPQTTADGLPDVDSFMASRGASDTEPTPSAAITGAGTTPGNYALTDKGVEPQAELSAFHADAGNDDPVIRSETRLQLTPQESAVFQKKVAAAGGMDAYNRQIAESANPSAPTTAPTPQTAAEKPTDTTSGTKLSRIGVNLENIPREQFPQAATRAVFDSTGFPKEIIDKYLAQNPNMTIRSQYGTGKAVTSDEILQKTKSGIYTVETPSAQMDKIRSEMRQMENPFAETVYQNVRKGIEESDNDIARGVKTGFVSGAAKIEKLFTNLAELTNHGALKDEDVTKGIEYKRQIERAYHDAIADAQIKDPSLKELIARAAGELPPGFLSTTAATVLTGSPISAMALQEGVENSDRGLVPALTGAAHGAFMGGAMGVLGEGATALQAAGRNAALGAVDASVQPGARIGDVVQGSATQGLLAGAFHQSEKPSALSIRQDAPPLRGSVADVGAPLPENRAPTEKPKIRLAPNGALGKGVEVDPFTKRILQDGQPTAYVMDGQGNVRESPLPQQNATAAASSPTSTISNPGVATDNVPREADVTARRIFSARKNKELKVIGRAADGRLLALDEDTGVRSLIKDPRAGGGNREAAYVAPKVESTPSLDAEYQIAPTTPAQQKTPTTMLETAQSAATERAGFTGEPLESAPPVPESPATLRAQFQSARDPNSPRAAVLITPGEQFSARPKGFAAVPVGEDGTLFIHRDKMASLGLKSAADIRAYITQNGFEPLIGKVSPVADTSRGASLRTEDAQSNELSTSIVNSLEAARAQAAVDQAQFPQAARQEMMPAQEAVARRVNEAPQTLTVGHDATATTERGTAINTKYAVVEASDLIASHDTALNPNPRFPSELQPRERGRIASEDQINRIARDVRPEYLADSPKASEGAPIVGEDGVVESGNGRTIALQRAYESSNESSSRYRSYLNDNAARLGLDPQAIEGARQPVLVRVRTSPVDRAQFAREANEQSVAAMSAGEQARSDAQKLSGNLMGQFYPADDGQIVTPANREFIRNFMGDVVSPAERGRYVTGDGQISQEGITRVRNAVFARAYGETPEGVAALQKLAESPDNNVRNITTAMLHKAGRFAAQKEAIATGARYPLDITNDLAAAMGKLSSLRDAGTTVDDYLKQGGLFGDDLTPLQKRALSALDANKRSAKAINAILDNYLRGTEAAGDPRQSGFFGKDVVPDKAALLEAAIQDATHEQTQKQQSTLFHTDDQGLLARPETSGNISPSDSPLQDARTNAVASPAQTSGRALNNQSGAIDLDLLTLGVRPFLKHDVLPRTVGAARVIRETADSIRATLAPVSRGDEAKGAARVIRANAADMARRYDIADKSLEYAHDYFAKQDGAANLDVLNRIETKQPQLDANTQNFANIIRGLLDGRRADVQALGLNRVKDFTREYFPQAFTDPQAARKFFDNPKRGAKLPTIADGVAAGLTPVTTNPVDLAMLQLRQADKYVMSQRTLAEMRAQGLAKYMRVGASPPDGWVKIDENIGTVYGAPAPQGGITIRGHLYAPEPAARIVNNYLSPGLGKYPVYRGWRGLSNLMNQAQLGLSFFHAGFTTLDTMISRTAVGLEDIFRYGKPVRGLKTIASTPVSPITNLIQGSKMMKEWMTPGSQGAEIASFVQAMSEGGGRARMDEFYRTTIAQNMKDAFAQGNIPGGVLRLPFAAMEKTSAPLMEWLVPRQKLGIFAEMARRELETNPNASHAERRDAMAKAWDSVDNRMGQLVYDNLFWQKSFKDLSMASVRSVGWNIGSLREIPGGAIDYAKAGGNVLRGRRPEFTHRMAYVTALPIVTGMIGGMTNYLLTGEPPKELKDYYFPRTGNMNEHGEPERISLPSYVKDIFAYSTHPLRTAGHKLHPLIGNIAEMLENKDYYGTEIRSSDDPIVKQASDMLSHFGAAFVPFSIQGTMKERTRGASWNKSLLPMIGITPAPAELNQTTAQAMMREAGAAKAGSFTRTKEQAEKSQLKRDLIRTARKGGNVDEQVQRAVDAGKLKPRDVLAINREEETPLQTSFKRLSLADALKVYAAMNADERKQVNDILETKKGKANQ